MLFFSFQTEDWTKLNYSDVDFSKSTAAPLNSAPCGDADNVVYSVPHLLSQRPTGEDKVVSSSMKEFV